MISDTNTENYWGSRRTYIMVVLCQIIGMPVFIGIVNSAVSYGAAGYILSYISVTIVFGIPLLYMEFIVSQFTARDCIDVWKIYPCVSHIGYIQVIWQIIVIIYNHLINSFIIHYLFLSFESPIPYYTCGSWANKNCDMLKFNYTINQDCIRRNRLPYCASLYTTYPEYQYWTYNMLRKDYKFQIAWRVCLASGFICLLTFLSAFKRKQSVMWVIEAFVLFPIIGYMILLMGSMLQKGVVEIYKDSLDSDFETFFKEFRMSTVLLQITFSLGIGSGMSFNLASRSCFRAPCYSNTVITVVVSVAVSVLAICTTAMMACPYAFSYGIKPEMVLKAPISLLFEKTPRFLREYQDKYFWLVLVYSSHAVLGIGTNVIYIVHLLEMSVARSAIVAQYPGLTSLIGVIVLYIITIPFLSDHGVRIMLTLRRCSCIIGSFIAVIECDVFVIWYGLEKLSEDVHFMQGIQPNKYTRVSWLVSSIVLTYTFLNEIIDQMSKPKNNYAYTVGWYVLLTTIGVAVIVFLLKLLIAAYHKRFREVIKLDPTWGPRGDVLQRSRAMFTAQAMTKEYLYRQYHLQAGIVARQKLSYCRTTEGNV